MATGWEEYNISRGLSSIQIKQFRYKPQRQLRKLFKAEKIPINTNLPIRIIVPSSIQFKEEYLELIDDLGQSNIPFINTLEQTNFFANVINEFAESKGDGIWCFGPSPNGSHRLICIQNTNDSNLFMAIKYFATHDMVSNGQNDPYAQFLTTYKTDIAPHLAIQTLGRLGLIFNKEDFPVYLRHPCSIPTLN